MFQSTPAIADGRTTAVRYKVVTMGFQSTPAIADGRTSSALDFIKGLNLFQSTPAIADGRTSRHGGMPFFWKVSIHARHR